MTDSESKISGLTNALSSGDVKTMGQEAINQQVASNSMCPSLSFKKRIICFSIWAGIGAIFGLISFIVLLSITTSPARFAVPYTISTAFLIASTFFLIGPLRQLKTMFHKTRIIVSIVLLSSIAMVLVSAFIIKNAWVVLIFVIVELCAFTWYALSYIPYARTAIIKLVKHGWKST